LQGFRILITTRGKIDAHLVSMYMSGRVVLSLEVEAERVILFANILVLVRVLSR